MRHVTTSIAAKDVHHLPLAHTWYTYAGPHAVLQKHSGIAAQAGEKSVMTTACSMLLHSLLSAWF